MTIFPLFYGFFAQNRAIFVRKDGFYPSKNDPFFGGCSVRIPIFGLFSPKFRKFLKKSPKNDDFSPFSRLFCSKSRYFPEKRRLFIAKKWSKNVIFEDKSCKNRLFCRLFYVFYGFYPQKWPLNRLFYRRSRLFCPGKIAKFGEKYGFFAQKSKKK